MAISWVPIEYADTFSCPICLENECSDKECKPEEKKDFVSHTEVQDKTNHVFHRFCIRRCIQDDSRCPLCRRDVQDLNGKIRIKRRNCSQDLGTNDWLIEIQRLQDMQSRLFDPTFARIFDETSEDDQQLQHLLLLNYNTIAANNNINPARVALPEINPIERPIFIEEPELTRNEKILKKIKEIIWTILVGLWLTLITALIITNLAPLLSPIPILGPFAEMVARITRMILF